MADRHQFRAKWHDYNVGIYFVTIRNHAIMSINIILNERSFENIMSYIDSNAEHWQDDCFNT